MQLGIYITSYLAIGSVFGVTGVLAKKVNAATKECWEENPDHKWNVVLIPLMWSILFVLIILFYPYLLADMYYHSIKKRKIKMREAIPKENMGARFDDFGGAGTIRCLDCHYSQEIVCFLHGMDDWNQTGFQCQACGKFHEIERDMHNSAGVRCECGGVLSNKKSLFCPQCKSKKVRYMMTYIT